MRETTVLVSGLGVMTRGILAHLAGHPGHTVALHSRHAARSPVPGVRCVSEDGLSALRPDVIVGCFENDDRSREFWSLEPIGEAVAAGAVCIELTTLGLAQVLWWHELIRASGGVGVECPVTGSRSGAESGTLSAFVHASGSDERIDQVLKLFVRTRYDFREPGHPTRFKLLYNAWGATMLATLSSFVPPLEELLGPDFPVAQRIIASDGWMALVCASKLDKMLPVAPDELDFALRHMRKDLGHAEAIMPRPDELFDVVRARFGEAEQRFGGEVDYTAVNWPSAR
ncbi:NAD(P)-binding domain-containing protein [Amycolatopsis panacis]|uniref:NAD(P)-dependent oxidoreductase n=1 Tax=Amycolatopsis panacis TaxID=2340917 RepID=A0A419HJG3_9PSEU|nr:NAD(P)-binding domain-containing protein [Amycolatopsis panacis]RJQ75877.1 NAD(P)-dependent oxidoreductase [Amycolatopsis panacis]